MSSHTHTHTRLTALVRDYPGEPVPEGKTNLDFTEARDSKWQWHQLGHMQVCTSLQTDNHASTPPLTQCHQSTCIYKQQQSMANTITTGIDHKWRRPVCQGAAEL